jgi:hypothetical protein
MAISMLKMIPSTINNIYSFHMDQLIIDAEELYDYLLNRVHTMFYPNKELIFVNLCGYTHATDEYIHSISNNDKDEIRLAFGTWLHQEIESNALFDKEFWQIFRKLESYAEIYICYRKLFIFKKYYFHVTYDFYFFGLHLYGWQADSDMLQPDNRVCIPLDYNIPDYDWYNSV